MTTAFCGSSNTVKNTLTDYSQGPLSLDKKLA